MLNEFVLKPKGPREGESAVRAMGMLRHVN